MILLLALHANAGEARPMEVAPPVAIGTRTLYTRDTWVVADALGHLVPPATLAEMFGDDPARRRIALDRRRSTRAVVAEEIAGAGIALLAGGAIFAGVVALEFDDTDLAIGAFATAGGLLVIGGVTDAVMFGITMNREYRRNYPGTYWSEDEARPKLEAWNEAHPASAGAVLVVGTRITF